LAQKLKMSNAVPYCERSRYGAVMGFGPALRLSLNVTLTGGFSELKESIIKQLHVIHLI